MNEHINTLTEDDRSNTAVAVGVPPAKSLGFSLSFFANDEQKAPGPAAYRLMQEASVYGDRNGYEAVWLPERHFHAFGGHFPNPAVLAASLATMTRHIGLRAGSVVAPLHHPMRIAEEWSVVDNLSNGRIGLSFASGWNINDFILSSTPFEDRRNTTNAVIGTTRGLWRGEQKSFAHENGSLEVGLFPKPVQADLPVWLTTSGRMEGFEAAGRLGTNVLTHLRGQDIVDLPEKIARYRQTRLEHGHPGPGHITLMMHTYVHEDRACALADIQNPLQTYLGSSLDLTQVSTKRAPDARSPSKNSKRLRAAMLANACERYMKESGLFGTPSEVIETANQLAKAGVDEIACLVDFGVEASRVMRSLELLTKVKDHLHSQATKLALENVAN
ncbi:MupA/Atu3671 family FMN-dependent luciferase-like monooxygenase [uncultured Roseobacter sp.]|uniref:MupA/Atu3671 family FMN-dependent luciferase-like monooxygenase n=1 Tax=uncultured Roseobacter sp. TaxID=114847 RepID=UPI00262C77FE|nr:MupA/Atu3671 family FMN-dependent luciferase-like monooxygenase [uncultured Roseobacter sp.]